MATTAKSRKRSSTAGHTLRNVVTTAAATETLVDLVQRLGLVDLVIGKVKSRIQETDLDDLFDEIGDYLRRNPEVLVVSLAITIATGALVFLNNRREWDGAERRRAAAS